MTLSQVLPQLAQVTAQSLRADEAIEGVKPTPALFKEAFHYALHTQGIENVTGLEGLVGHYLARQDRDLYRQIWPEIHMDENGNCTTDSTRWA